MSGIPVEAVTEDNVNPDDATYLNQFDLLTSAASGALEAARNACSWLAVHGEKLQPEQQLHNVLRARGYAVLAAMHLNELATMVDPDVSEDDPEDFGDHEGADDADDPEDFEEDSEAIPCGHSTCAQNFVDTGDPICIEAVEEDEDDEDEADDEA